MESFQNLWLRHIHFFFIYENHERFAKSSITFQTLVYCQNFELLVRFNFIFILNKLFNGHLDNVWIFLIFSEVPWSNIMQMRGLSSNVCLKMNRCYLRESLRTRVTIWTFPKKLMHIVIVRILINSSVSEKYKRLNSLWFLLPMDLNIFFD
jgi:hypothetical protein